MRDEVSLDGHDKFKNKSPPSIRLTILTRAPKKRKLPFYGPRAIKRLSTGEAELEGMLRTQRHHNKNRQLVFNIHG